MRTQLNERLVTILIVAGSPVGIPALAVAQSGPLEQPFREVIPLSTVTGIGATIVGSDPFPSVGGRVRHAGDINGDGVDDLLISTRGYDGPVYVVFGNSAGRLPGSVAELDGTNGFQINNPFGGTGSTAGAFDINGDGVDDVIIGDAGGGPSREGRAYVVFGSREPFPMSFDLALLDGSNGFVVVGADPHDRAGAQVAGIGDANGDGVDDVAITSVSTDLQSRGRAFVVFGNRTGFDDTFELASLDGTNGFRVLGASEADIVSAVSGAGDLNADGYSDLVFGSVSADAPAGRLAGSAFVLFGGDDLGSEVEFDDFDGTNGFRLNGGEQFDRAGRAVSTAGDVNGDGIDDVVIGAYWAGRRGDGGYHAGASYVVLGRNDGFNATIDLGTLDGTDGFRIDGADNTASSGYDVGSAGDINGDGFDDTLIGAPFTGFQVISYYPYERQEAYGAAYVIFGRGDGFPDVVAAADLDGEDGFRLEGVAEGRVGRSVSFAGDVNGDGNDDIIVGEYAARPTGASHLIFGRNLFQCAPDLDGDGELTIFDFLQFGNLFELMDARVDFDGDGDFTLFDFLAFQNAFDAGCP